MKEGNVNHSFVNGLKELWEIIKDDKAIIRKIFFFMLFAEIINLSVPLLFKFIIDRVVVLIENQQVENELFFLFAIGIFLTIISIYWSSYFVETSFMKFQAGMERKMPTKVFQKLLFLSLNFHRRENTGKKVKKIERGSFMVTRVLSIVRDDALPSILNFLINTGVIFYLSWKIGLFLLFPLIPAIAINRQGVKKLRPEWEKSNKKDEKSSGIFYDSVANIFTVQSCCQEKEEINRFKTAREEIEKIDIENFCKIRGYHFWSDLITQIFRVLTIALSCILAIKGEISIGTVFFITIIGGTIYQNAFSIIRGYFRISEHLISIARMKKILDENFEVENERGSIVPKYINGSIELKNIHYFYPRTSGKEVLKGVCLLIEPGQMVAFVGRSGAGKTTIVNLMRRSYDPINGDVFLDGSRVRELNLFWYRKLFAVVPQVVEILNNSILENIRYSYPDAGENEVMEAIEAANLTDEINDPNRFPDGIYTDLSERGSDLSGGQRQRIAIARAYLGIKKGARFLVLDESTSDLDSITERSIQKMIDNLKNSGISIISIAHRLSTIRKADKIFVVDDGMIVESGNHEELMDLDGVYAQLIEFQKLD